MKSAVSRLLLFFLAVPAILCLVIFLPFRNNLAFALLCLGFSCLGTLELSAMLKEKGIVFPVWYSLILGLMLVLASAVSLHFRLQRDLTGLVTVLGFIIILSGSIFPHKNNSFEKNIHDIGGGLLLFVYPGFFMAYLIRLCFLPGARWVILILLAMVFISDGLAYAAGMLFGKKKLVRLAASPNKTLIGFFVIPLVCMGVALFGGFLMSKNFKSDVPVYLLIGFITGCASILGDLAESAIKRSAKRKDSGAIIPGRGGVLDSIDSLLFSAPVYYYLVRVLLEAADKS